MSFTPKSIFVWSFEAESFVGFSFLSQCELLGILTL